jgi:peptide/nickel transport system permease protein
MLLDASRSLTAEVDRVLASDFILFARANGQPLLRHLVPNLLAPLASWTANRVTALAAGAIVVETIFNLPGLGRLTWRAALDRDASVVLGVTLAWALVFTAGRSLAHGLAALQDPRGRTELMGAP